MSIVRVGCTVYCAGWLYGLLTFVLLLPYEQKVAVAVAVAVDAACVEM
jgi:hypothetical protein